MDNSATESRGSVNKVHFGHGTTRKHTEKFQSPVMNLFHFFALKPSVCFRVFPWLNGFTCSPE
jgi:hypothetical protein